MLQFNIYTTSYTNFSIVYFIKKCYYQRKEGFTYEKKLLSIFIIIFFIFNFSTITFASEYNSSNKEISKDDFKLLFSAINNNTWTENGQTVYINDFCITYNNYTSDTNIRSVYQDTKQIHKHSQLQKITVFI